MYADKFAYIFFVNELILFGVILLAPKQTISPLSAFKLSLFKDSHWNNSLTIFSKTTPDFLPEQNGLVSSS